MTEPFSAFFYGTLLHPSILRRVIGHQGETLEICPALLPEHTRHQVKYADYPAVLPYSKSSQLFPDPSTAPSPHERTVRGTLVTGLTRKDIRLLDVFEGTSYVRTTVAVHPLAPPTPLSAVPTPTATNADASLGPLASATPPGTLPTAVPAQTYIWTDPISDLTPALWEFADFVRENAWKWVGEGARFNEDYTAVDHTRAMAGSAPGSPEGEDGQV